MRRAHQVRSYGSNVTSNDSRNQPTSDASTADCTCLPQYEIRVNGHLGSRWAAWFDGLNLTTENDGVTLISGPVVDQAALHGLLNKLRDLGIPLVSLVQLPPSDPAEPANLNNNNNPSTYNPQGATP